MTGDMADIVSEFLVYRSEQLLEVAETAGHGFAPHIDDRRSRQYLVDQADVPEIVRHLVDEERPAQPAIGTGFGQEALAERAGLPRPSGAATPQAFSGRSRNPDR